MYILELFSVCESAKDIWTAWQTVVNSVVQKPEQAWLWFQKKFYESGSFQPDRGFEEKVKPVLPKTYKPVEWCQCSESDYLREQRASVDCLRLWDQKSLSPHLESGISICDLWQFLQINFQFSQLHWRILLSTLLFWVGHSNEYKVLNQSLMYDMQLIYIWYHVFLKS